MDRIKEISDILDGNGVNCTNVCEADDGIIEICIDGDWKHDHAFARNLLTKEGLIYLGQEVRESTGDDSYEALHYYKINE